MMVNASLFCRSRPKGFQSPARQEQGGGRRKKARPSGELRVLALVSARQAPSDAGPTEIGSAAMGMTDGDRPRPP